MFFLVLGHCLDSWQERLWLKLPAHRLPVGNRHCKNRFKKQIVVGGSKAIVVGQIGKFCSQITSLLQTNYLVYHAVHNAPLLMCASTHGWVKHFNWFHQHGVFGGQKGTELNHGKRWASLHNKFYCQPQCSLSSLPLCVCVFVALCNEFSSLPLIITDNWWTVSSSAKWRPVRVEKLISLWNWISTLRLVHRTRRSVSMVGANCSYKLG